MVSASLCDGARDARSAAAAAGASISVDGAAAAPGFPGLATGRSSPPARARPARRTGRLGGGLFPLR